MSFQLSSVRKFQAHRESFITSRKVDHFVGGVVVQRAQCGKRKSGDLGRPQVNREQRAGGVPAGVLGQDKREADSAGCAEMALSHVSRQSVGHAWTSFGRGQSV